jgi:hypothetical protein
MAIATGFIGGRWSGGVGVRNVDRWVVEVTVGAKPLMFATSG